MNLLIKNGHVIDPFLGIDEIRDVAIKGRYFCEPEDNIAYKHVIDASGCLVTPGLIDFHLHLFDKGSDVGLPPDTALLPCGVTSAVDAGSTGYSNYGAFSELILKRTKLTVRAFLNVCPAGLVTSAYHENIKKEYINLPRICELWDIYNEELLGLKIRFTKEIVGETGISTLAATVEAADKLHCPVVVHTTNPPVPVKEIIDVLRPGDIYCHMFQGRGHTIVDETGNLHQAVYEGRKKGIIFDAASGKNHYCNDVAKASVSQGFLPDVISTDLSGNTVYQTPVYSLPFMMSKHLNLGMSLFDVVKASSATPAALMGMKGKLGTVKNGAFADLAIFKLKRQKTNFYDFKNDKIEGEYLLIPQMTVKNGDIVYRQVDFLESN